MEVQPMDDKLFDLVSKMYSEMQEMQADIKETKADLKEVKADLKETKADLKETKADLKETKADLKETKSDVKRLFIKIENDIEPKLQALFDGYKQTYEMTKANSIKLDEIAEKVTKQEVEIKVIQGGKK
jgi:chromosome segregation ATPase